ncbi:MAG TPA: hypothetical protein VLH56_18675 [Dissulfurispiraceae bacterium]|nr:hypothetical protein [Dissulfurispiraceae bacterium]
MIVYRIENPDTMHGMWYKLDGTWAPFIFTLTEGISRDLPMGYHPRYSAGGKKWFSAGKSKENMNQWFSARDALELSQADYKLFEFDVSEFAEEEHQVIFTREGVVSCKEIPLNFLWEV